MIGYIVVTIGLCFIWYVIGFISGYRHCFDYLRRKLDEAKERIDL